MNQKDEAIAQQIIDAIQRGETDADETVKTYIGQADAFLLKNGEKPDFYDAFIEIASRDLKTTINGCVKSRNHSKKKDDLKKYKEGYFYEIVQNANDIVWKVPDIQNPKMAISVAKRENDGYKVTCTYPDAGFTLENIYGFCTRGNSDKETEKGQEGMYGIGIKSLLCFVDELEIDSNISIKIHPSPDGKMLGEVDITDPKKDRQKMETVLSFTFTCPSDNQEPKKHAGFNTRKLAELIDQIYEENGGAFDRFFFNGEDDEMVFDARSLFFTELRGENRTLENSIKCIEIQKEVNGQLIPVLEIKSKEEQVCSGQATVKIAEINGYFKYMIFHYKDEQISIAFEYNQEKESEDRLYATYFIGTYDREKSLLGKKTGCLVNTTAINSSRSGLEREKEEDPEILKSIMEKGKESVRILCSLITREDSISKDPFHKIYMDVLCQLLWIFRKEYIDNEEERYPVYIFGGNFENVQKSVGNWYFSNGCRLILEKEDGIDNERVCVNQPGNSDDENTAHLFEIYKKYLNPGEEKDIVVYHSVDYEKFTSGIKNLSKAIFEEGELWINEMINLPFLSGIKDVILYRIGGNAFSNIQEYLNTLDENDRIYMKQLIARYEVNDCFDYMGSYSDQNIKNWLFESESNDPEYKKKAEEYESDYGELKQRVQPFIDEIEYYESPNGNAHAEWWFRCIRPSAKTFPEELFPDDYILQLLRLIRSFNIYVGMKNNACFVHNISVNMKLQNRDRSTKNWTGTFKRFNLDILDQDMSSFQKFKIARKYVDEYNNSVTVNKYRRWHSSSSDDFKLLSVKNCTIQEMKLSEVKEVFAWLATYEHVDVIGQMNIRKIDFEGQEQGSSSLIRFVKFFMKEEVFIKLDVVSVKNNRRKFIGFAANLNGKSGMYIKTSADDGFRSIGETETSGENYLLIYSSFKDEQEVLSKVVEELGYEKEICYYIKNFMKAGNTKMIATDMYSKFLKRRRMEYQYPFEYEGLQSEKLERLSLEASLDLLTGKMSYDSHCPICRSMPTLDLEEPNIHRLENKNFLVAILEAKYREIDIYVKILCCKSCFKEYKDSLTEAVIEDVPGAAYKKMILKNTISTIAMSRDIENEVLISPDNWSMIWQFNPQLEEAKL